jgi:exopolysaccharide biosynthesis polyprenyl glycosylphosphotransferase
MLAKYPTAIDFASLLVVGSQVPLPEGPRLVYDAVLMMAIAMFARYVAREVRPRRTRIVILGAGRMAEQLIEEVESAEPRRYAVAGVIDNQQPPEDSPLHQRWLGTCDELAAIVARVQPAEIVVAVENRRDRLPLQSLLESRVSGIDVEDAIEFYERVTGKMAIEALRPSSLIMSKGFRNHGAPEATARLVSILVAIVGLILFAPLLAAIALLVKLDSRGPVLFIQERAGRHGRPFGLLKFRTMHPTNERPSEWVLDNIHRITRVGKYLRRFRLDELPQLVNVLRGEMNLVGPRPHPTSNHATFMEHIAYYGLRSTVRPGVTGWAQVRYGYANNLDEETEKMRYDLFYIKNRSLWLDFTILLWTVGIMLFGQGASQVRHPAPFGRGQSVPVKERRQAVAGDWVERRQSAPPARAPEVSMVPVLADTGVVRSTPGRQ